VVSVVKAGPAGEAGLREGDVIVEVDGVAVARVDDLHRLLTERQIGRAVVVAVVRENRRTVLRVVPAEAGR